MSGLNKHLPGVLTLQKQQSEVSVSSLCGKIVFFYFSASWCPPCRGFTPVLIEFYEKYHDSKNFEVVLVTWDEEEEGFNGYYGKMPWLTIPFSQRHLVESLTKAFNVGSIPTVIGVCADSGEIVTTRARHALTQDPNGDQFPWRD